MSLGPHGAQEVRPTSEFKHDPRDRYSARPSRIRCQGPDRLFHPSRGPSCGRKETRRRCLRPWRYLGEESQTP